MASQVETQTKLFSSRRDMPSSALPERVRSQAQRFWVVGSRSPDNISTTYLPRMGRNLKPWKEPQVAIYSPSQAE